MGMATFVDRADSDDDDIVQSQAQNAATAEDTTKRFKVFPLQNKYHNN